MLFDCVVPSRLTKASTIFNPPQNKRKQNNKKILFSLSLSLSTYLSICPCHFSKLSVACQMHISRSCVRWRLSSTQNGSSPFWILRHSERILLTQNSKLFFFLSLSFSLLFIIIIIIIMSCVVFPFDHPTRLISLQLYSLCSIHLSNPRNFLIFLFRPLIPFSSFGSLY